MERLANALKWTRTPCSAEVSAKAKKKSYQQVYAKNRRRTDIAFRVLCSLRGRTGSAVKSQTAKKYASTKALLGCTLVEFKAHIESLFTDGMAWSNYGQWHIDHVRPCCEFDLLDPEQQRACFHWSNLQPLWAIDNMRKGGRPS